MSAIEINPQFEHALSLLNDSGEPVFITGKAGTGKSTLLQHFRLNTNKNVVFLAPTGVAALNIQGQTIHSFFQFAPGITPDQIKKKKIRKNFQSLLKKIDTIIIDEISMVRADLLDCIDCALQYYLKNKEPFGGKQLVVIGDLYQLPPVVASDEEADLFKNYYESPYFFSAKVCERFKFTYIELETVYRQKDSEFIDLLNTIRNNTITADGLSKLNQRFQPSGSTVDVHDDLYITLTTTNRAADMINGERIMALDEDMQQYSATIRGEFEQKQFPTAKELQVKIGAQIMLLNNDSDGRWVNGSVGTIMDIKTENKKDVLEVELLEGRTVLVEPHTWEVNRYYLNEGTKKLDVEVIGSFRQYPVRLAWAITIHKSQGKTFDHVVVDIGRGSFAHGQVYVALSRCTNFAGLVLRTPIQKNHIWMDDKISHFLAQCQYHEAEKNLPAETRLHKLAQAIEREAEIELSYLKPNDQKIKRVFQPLEIDTITEADQTYAVVKVRDKEIGCKIILRIDRILTIDDES